MQLSQIQVIPDVSDYDIVEPVYLNAVGNYDGVTGEIYLRGFEIDREIEGENIDIEYYVYDENGERDEFGDPSTLKTGRAATYYDPSFDSHFIAIEDYVTLIADPEDGSMDASVQIQYANQVGAPLITTISIPVRPDQELPDTESTEATHEKTIHDKQPTPAVDYGSFLVEAEVTPPSIVEEEDEPSFEEEPEQPIESTATTEEEYLGIDPTNQVIDAIVGSVEGSVQELDISTVVPQESDLVEPLDNVSDFEVFNATDTDSETEQVEETPTENLLQPLLNASTIGILNRLAGKTSSTSTKSLYYDYERKINANRSNPQLERNTDFWGYGLKNITAISAFNNSEERRRARFTHGVAITPRHILLSEHAGFANPVIGDELGFYDEDNNEVKRTVVGHKSMPVRRGSTAQPDLSIAVLDSDLPSSIGFIRVMPSDIINNIPSDELEVVTSTLGWLSLASVTSDGVFVPGVPDRRPRFEARDIGALIWATNQKENSGIFQLTKITLSTDAAGDDYYPDLINFGNGIQSFVDQGFNTRFQTNDSGSPILTVINDEAVLIGITRTTQSAPLVGGRNTEVINKLISDIDLQFLDTPTNYTLTSIDYNLEEEERREFTTTVETTTTETTDEGTVTTTEYTDGTTETSTEKTDGTTETVTETPSGTKLTVEETPGDSTTTTTETSDGSTETVTETTVETKTTTETSDGKTETTTTETTTTETTTEKPDGSTTTTTETSDGKTETTSTTPSTGPVTENDPKLSDRLGSKEDTKETYTLTVVNEGDLDLTIVGEGGFKPLKSKGVFTITQDVNRFTFVLTKLDGVESIRFENARVDIIGTRGNLVGGNTLDNIVVDAVISQGYNAGTIYVHIDIVDDYESEDSSTTDDSTTTDDSSTTDDSTTTDDSGTTDDSSTTDDSGTTDSGGRRRTCDLSGITGGGVCVPEGGTCIPDDGGCCIPFDPTTTTVDEPFDPPPTYIPNIPDIPFIPIIPFTPANCGKRPVVRIGIPPQEDPDNPGPEVIEVIPEDEILLFPAPVLGLQPPFLSNVNFDTNVTLAVPLPLDLEEDEDEPETLEPVQTTAREKINLCEDEECNTLGF